MIPPPLLLLAGLLWCFAHPRQTFALLMARHRAEERARIQRAAKTMAAAVRLVPRESAPPVVVSVARGPLRPAPGVLASTWVHWWEDAESSWFAACGHFIGEIGQRWADDDDPERVTCPECRARMGVSMAEPEDFGKGAPRG